MAEATAPPLSARDEQTIEERVLEVVRGMASELGAGRALRALTPGSSLERDAGLGSLERVELLLRLEAAFGRSLDEAALQADTVEELARAVRRAGGRAAVGATSAPPALPAASPLRSPAATVHG
ncbi:MAG TPA: phosphopantetheine-binding protein, partial [Vicinamibacteria bacterium]|nr:phosphopantetheine-binding protein [Vicinamibacteria bacterium]